MPTPVRGLHSHLLDNDSEHSLQQGALHHPIQSSLLHYELTRDRIGHLSTNVIDSLKPGPQLGTKPGEGPSSNQSVELTPSPTSTCISTPTSMPMPTPTPMPKPMPMPAAPLPLILDESNTINDAIVEELSTKDLWVSHCAGPEDHEPTDKSPSRYLQMACPLCYPGQVFEKYGSAKCSGASVVLTLCAGSACLQRLSIQWPA